LHEKFLIVFEVELLMKYDILEISIVDKSLSLGIFSSYSKFICLKVLKIGKSLSLESDEYKYFINGKPSHTLPQGVPREVKRMRKGFIKEVRVWQRLFWP
jgi:hypothetical protein